MVLATALTLLGLAGCATPGPPQSSTGPGGTIPPESISVQGRTIPYDSLQPVTAASIASRSSKTLTVFVTGSPDRGGSACGPPAIRILTQETPKTVRILVANYEAPASPGLACAAIGYLPGPQPARLSAPLADRSVLDVSTGKTVPVLDASTVPDLTNPPAPFTTSVVSQRPGEPVERWWSYRRGDDQRQMALLTAPPAVLDRVRPPYGRIVRQFSVHGTLATLYAESSDANASYEAQWTPNSRQTIRLELLGSPQQHWTEEQAMSLSRAVTGYRTSPVVRIAPPRTPGTVAATYSSEDGPVVHATNLLKSSGVWVGLTCRGVGSVTVTIRGVVHVWPCVGDTRSHVTESFGKPYEPFVLDVHGTAGVRWTVSLARASLDGT